VKGNINTLQRLSYRFLKRLSEGADATRSGSEFQFMTILYRAITLCSFKKCPLVSVRAVKVSRMFLSTSCGFTECLNTNKNQHKQIQKPIYFIRITNI